MEKIIPAAAAFVGGALISYLNSLITRAALKKGAGMVYMMPVRTLIAAGFLAALYFISVKAGFDPVSTLIAGAVGHTAGLVFFTLRQMKARGDGSGEEDGANG
ncbi:MAG: hypothetical protein J5586_07715 [Clostridia bacterium]|nr:hypothetical protein [Clostridia bacterium]